MKVRFQHKPNALIQNTLWTIWKRAAAQKITFVIVNF